MSFSIPVSGNKHQDQSGNGNGIICSSKQRRRDDDHDQYDLQEDLVEQHKPMLMGFQQDPFILTHQTFEIMLVAIFSPFELRT